MSVLLFAAHQGEEFVLILPAIMLVGAFFILRWANQSDDDDGENHADGNELVSDDELLKEADPVGTGERAD